MIIFAPITNQSRIIMKTNSLPPFYSRRSVRLKNYDYSSDGLYFVTICTEQRRCLFGRINDGKVKLTYWGEYACQCWEQIPNHFPQIILHDYVVMPNHIHGILQIDNSNDTSFKSNDCRCLGRGETSFAPATYASPLPSLDTKNNQPAGTSQTIGSIVRGFKIGVTSEVHKLFPKIIVWQRNYHEHIIRTQKSYDIISNYILDNPNRWVEDCFYEE